MHLKSFAARGSCTRVSCESFAFQSILFKIQARLNEYGLPDFECRRLATGRLVPIPRSVTQPLHLGDGTD